MIAPDCLPENQHRLTGHKWCRDDGCECSCHESQDSLPLDPEPCTDPTCGAVLYGGAPAHHWHEQDQARYPRTDTTEPGDKP